MKVTPWNKRGPIVSTAVGFIRLSPDVSNKLIFSMDTGLEVVSSTTWVPREYCQVTAPIPLISTLLVMGGPSLRLV
jgi:hypothetical protein